MISTSQQKCRGVHSHNSTINRIRNSFFFDKIKFILKIGNGNRRFFQKKKKKKLVHINQVGNDWKINIRFGTTSFVVLSGRTFTVKWSTYKDVANAALRTLQLCECWHNSSTFKNQRTFHFALKHQTRNSLICSLFCILNSQWRHPKMILIPIYLFLHNLTPSSGCHRKSRTIKWARPINNVFGWKRRAIYISQSHDIPGSDLYWGRYESDDGAW